MEIHQSRTSHYQFRAEDYHIPREIEHPIVPLSEVSTNTFVWLQPQVLRAAYELWGDAQVVATLRYRGLSLGEGLGVAAEGLWTFEHNEKNPNRIDIISGSVQVGTVIPERSFRDHILLDGGYSYHFVQQGLSEPTGVMTDVLGHTILRSSPFPGGAPRMRVHVNGKMRAMKHMPMLLVLGQYLFLSRSGQRFGSGRPATGRLVG